MTTHKKSKSYIAILRKPILRELRNIIPPAYFSISRGHGPRVRMEVEQYAGKQQCSCKSGRPVLRKHLRMPAAPRAARQDEGRTIFRQATMFLQIWTPSCAETFAYASLVGYLHPDARPMAARQSVPQNNRAEIRKPAFFSFSPLKEIALCINWGVLWFLLESHTNK